MIIKYSVLINKYYSELPLKLNFILLLCLLVTLIQVINQYVYHLATGYDFEFSYGFVTIKSLINNLCWVILLPPIYYVIVRFKRGIYSIRPTHVIFGLVLIFIPLLHRAVSLLAYNYAFSFQSGHVRSFFGANNITDLSGGYFLSVVELVVVLAVLIALDYQKILMNKEKDLAKAQLHALKMQLHPHFLFNTLHSISSMIDLDAREAQRMITRVGDLFRVLLERDERDLITLAEEMSFVQNYLELEHIRFQDRLKLNIDVAVADSVLVPSMILQPIIENSIKYGVNKQAADSYIDIIIKNHRSSDNSTMLLLSVINGSKAPLNVTAKNGFGIGHKNVKRRLTQSYQDKFECSFGMVDPFTYKSTILIPLQYD